ncbi:MFS transporter [Chromatiales bacterium (ex Bugula neritina AB1)]|nr:MFS transporter [Chromatiales bacterium (ex Bugula neritina AB1)]
MFTVLKNSWALMLGMLLLMLGNGLQGTLLGVRGSIENISPQWLGYVMSGYFIGFLLSSRLTPHMLKRVGHVRVFAALGSVVSAVFILFPVWVNPWFWLVLRILVGFCFCGIYIVAESWLNDSSSNETRGQALSLYLIVQMAGIVLGQLLLNIADPGGYELFVLITVLVSVSFAPILLSATPAPLFETSRPMSLRELTLASPLGCVGVFMLGGVFAAIFGMAAIYANQRGFSILETSYFVTAIYTGGLVLQYPIGWMSDRIDRRWLIIAVAGSCTLICTAVIFLDSNASLLIAAFLMGGTTNPLYSLLIAYTNDFLESDQMAAASGGLLFINGIGAMSGPIIVGYLMNKFGPSAFFIFIAVLMAIICIYGIYRVTQRAATSVDDTVSYIPLTTRSTQIAAEIAIEISDEDNSN